MGIAVRMATLMMLHREETFNMQNPTPELIMRAESARRTLVSDLSFTLNAPQALTPTSGCCIAKTACILGLCHQSH